MSYGLYSGARHTHTRRATRDVGQSAEKELLRLQSTLHRIRREHQVKLEAHAKLLRDLDDLTAHERLVKTEVRLLKVSTACGACAPHTQCEGGGGLAGCTTSRRSCCADTQRDRARVRATHTPRPDWGTLLRDLPVVQAPSGGNDASSEDIRGASANTHVSCQQTA